MISNRLREVGSFIALSLTLRVERPRANRSRDIGTREVHAMKRMVRAHTLWIALAWLAFASVATAETLPYAKPEEVGFSSERLGRVTEMLRTNIAAGEIPGAVLLIARRGK